MKFHAMASAVVVFLVSTAAFAQESKTPPASSNSKGEQASQANPNPFSTYNKIFFTRMKTILVSSAEKMPEENYNFKPTEAVRSYGQIVGHVADAQYTFCSLALGENNPGFKIEQTKTTKADLVAALKDAVAYCDKAYDGMTDASGSQMVKLFGGDIPKLGVLSINNMYDMEHYGNLVTYMRLKNIVPPTTEQAQAAQQKK
jgi:DinB superfamily